MWPRVLVCVDPGVTTGIAVVLLTETSIKLLEVHQWGDSDTVWEKIYSLARYWGHGYHTMIVCESFDFRPGVVNPDYTPKFIIKDIERYITDIEIVYQIPSSIKTLVKPAKNGNKDQLHRFNLYQRGKRHANDAIRHAIVWATKNRHEPTILLGWPRKT